MVQMYKRHDPNAVEEIEFMENLFNSLCSALMLPANRDRFLKGEGIQLMNLMLRLPSIYFLCQIFSVCRIYTAIQNTIRLFQDHYTVILC